jgi:hypothetical protein
VHNKHDTLDAEAILYRPSFHFPAALIKNISFFVRLKLPLAGGSTLPWTRTKHSLVKNFTLLKGASRLYGSKKEKLHANGNSISMVQDLQVKI